MILLRGEFWLVLSFLLLLITANVGNGFNILQSSSVQSFKTTTRRSTISSSSKRNYYQSSSCRSQQHQQRLSSTTTRSFQLNLAPPSKVMEPDEIKRQLNEYLDTRQKENADEKAKSDIGKTVGGTKGNKVLNYISGAPVKERTIDRIPNIFDYDELTKYGYSNLITPIMNLGGRRAVYELMDMEAPPLPGPPPKLKAAKLEIDRKGETDQARYTGLKMGQILDDDAMAEALANAQSKASKGERLRPKLVEEEYELPFADKRNVGPQQTPEWTPERLDEYATQQGKAISWAKKAKMGEYMKDPDEDLTEMPLLFRVYCSLVAFEIAFAFGRSTPTFLLKFLNISSDQGSLLNVAQSLGLALSIAAIGGSVVCGILLAPEKNRSSFVWTVKGLIGGPLAVRQLRELDALITRGENEELMKRNN